MAANDRIIRKESRVRGSGKRNVQNNQEFNIIAKQGKKGVKNRQSGSRRSLISLKSALNPDNIENLPRLRSRPSIGSTDNRNVPPLSTSTTKVNTLQSSSKPNLPVLESIVSAELEYENVTPAHQIKSSVYDDIDLPLNSSNVEEQFGDGNFDYDDDFTTNADEVSSDTVQKVQEPLQQTQVKSKRGRPKKVKSEQESRKKRGRPKRIESDTEPPLAVEHPTRRSIPRSSKPSKLREIPSDDDLESTLENDAVSYRASTHNLTNQTLRGSSKLKDLLSSSRRKKSESIVKKEGEAMADRIARISKTVSQRDNDLNKRKRNKPLPTKPVRVLRPRGITTTVRSTATTTKPSNPVPLSKTKVTEKQKPMTIDFERLSDANTKDRRYKINTLDVLKYLIKEFEPAESKSTVIKQSVLQQDFKAHVLSQLQHLGDIHSTINELTSRISQVQRQKNEFRKRILDLRNDHGEVGKELNVLRVKYNEDKKNLENLSFINDELSQIIGGNQNVNDDIDNLVHNRILDLTKVINPNSGMFSKLKHVNEKLAQLDSSLD